MGVEWWGWWGLERDGWGQSPRVRWHAAKPTCATTVACPGGRTRAHASRSGMFAAFNRVERGAAAAGGVAAHGADALQAGGRLPHRVGALLQLRALCGRDVAAQGLRQSILDFRNLCEGSLKKIINRTAAAGRTAGMAPAPSSPQTPACPPALPRTCCTIWEAEVRPRLAPVMDVRAMAVVLEMRASWGGSAPCSSVRAILVTCSSTAATFLSSSLVSTMPVTCEERGKKNRWRHS